MSNLNIFNSLIEKFVRKHNTYKISKSSDLYNYIITECPSFYGKDVKGDYLVDTTTYDLEKEKKLKKLARRLFEEPAIVKVGSESYNYFVEEFANNKMAKDIYGNILVRSSDEPKTKSKKL